MDTGPKNTVSISPAASPFPKDTTISAPVFMWILSTINEISAIASFSAAAVVRSREFESALNAVAVNAVTVQV